MRINLSILAATVLAILLSACSEKNKHSSDDEALIKAKWSDFISHWENLDAVACASFYTEDCTHIPPGFPANNGILEVEAFYTELFESTLEANYRHETKSIKISGSIAIERGDFQAQWLSKDSTEWAFNARFLAHWEKSSSGDWKIKSFVFNLPPDRI